jgi:hypothetical protein
LEVYEGETVKIDAIAEPLPPPKQYVVTCSKDEFELLYYSVFYAAHANRTSTVLNILLSTMMDTGLQSYAIAKKFNLRDV